MLAMDPPFQSSLPASFHLKHIIAVLQVLHFIFPHFLNAFFVQTWKDGKDIRYISTAELVQTNATTAAFKVLPPRKRSWILERFLDCILTRLWHLLTVENNA